MYVYIYACKYMHTHKHFIMRHFSSSVVKNYENPLLQIIKKKTKKEKKKRMSTSTSSELLELIKYFQQFQEHLFKKNSFILVRTERFLPV